MGGPDMAPHTPPNARRPGKAVAALDIPPSGRPGKVVAALDIR